MPEGVRIALIACSLTFVAVGGYYRIRSQQSGERLDRSKEGWLILIDGMHRSEILQTSPSRISWRNIDFLMLRRIGDIAANPPASKNQERDH
jgi:hypothetical protein